MKTYTIADVSKLYGVNSSTLRYYEEMGLLKDVGRTETGRRIYTRDHVDRLGAIECFKSAGMTIAELRDFFAFEEDEKNCIEEMLSLLNRRKDLAEEKMRLMLKSYRQLLRKIMYYEAIKEATVNNTAHPQWEDYADAPVRPEDFFSESSNQSHSLP